MYEYILKRIGISFDNYKMTNSFTLPVCVYRTIFFSTILFGQNETKHLGFYRTGYSANFEVFGLLGHVGIVGSPGHIYCIVESPGPIYCSVMLEKGSPGTTLATEKEGIILKSCKKGLVIEKDTFLCYCYRE